MLELLRDCALSLIMLIEELLLLKIYICLHQEMVVSENQTSIFLLD
jgi:hypothetical protein